MFFFFFKIVHVPLIYVPFAFSVRERMGEAKGLDEDRSACESAEKAVGCFGKLLLSHLWSSFLNLKVFPSQLDAQFDDPTATTSDEIIQAMLSLLAKDGLAA